MQGARTGMSRIEDLHREIARLRDVNRRALALADERAKEANELRAENERLRAQLVECKS